ncbi:MAG: HlyD family type I secretion periplasmic adaptor subunit [Alphaproteobacteria bacterium]|nr:HlyD family type I secretion periplasmic adaptor subunit [Alphaproteobacteria bacterium]
MSYEDDILKELEGAADRTPARPVFMFMYALMALVVAFFIWAALAEVEELTRGQGQVVPSRDIQIVQSLEGGILQELLVAKGDLVKRGQILMRLQDVLFSSEERGTEANLMSLKAKKARLTAEAEGAEFVPDREIEEKLPNVAKNEQNLYVSRQKELEAAYSIQDDKIKKAMADLKEVEAEINRIYSSRKLLQEELNVTKQMVAKRAVPKLEQTKLERELSDLSGQINARSQEKEGLEAQLRVAEQERESQFDKFRSTALEELNEVEAKIAGIKENLRAMGDRVDRAEIRAPVDGVVNEIMINTIGGVVEPAMKLIEIVPNDESLKIIANVKPDDIAFLHVGQKVKVKITAYDPTKYGSLDGELMRVAANSSKDNDGNILFEVEVVTDKNFLGSKANPLPITSGMVANVEIITGKRTILNYLMKPIFRGFDSALRER